MKKKIYWNRLVLFFILIFLMNGFLQLSIQPAESLWTGIEGPHVGIAGFKPRNADYRWTNEQFVYEESTYPKYYYTTLGKHQTVTINQIGWYPCAGERSGKLTTEVRDLLVLQEIIPDVVDYWIIDKNYKGEVISERHYIGDIVKLQLVLQIYLNPGSGTNPCFVVASCQSTWAQFGNGDEIWFGIGTVKWDRAVSDPDNPDASFEAGYSIPLAMYISYYDPTGRVDDPHWSDENDNPGDPSDEWINECVDLSPSERGRTVELFPEPMALQRLDELWYEGELSQEEIEQRFGVIGSVLRDSPIPDSMLSNNAYFSIVIENFCTKNLYDFWTTCQTEKWYPAVYYEMWCYYLRLGEFIITSEFIDLPDWVPREWVKTVTPVYEFWNGFFETLGILNPFGIFGPFAPFVAFLFTLGIIFVVALILIAVFAPWLLPGIVKGIKTAGGLAKKGAESAGELAKKGAEGAKEVVKGKKK